MQSVSIEKKENTTLDIFKMLACVMITATHLPSFFQTEMGTFYYNQWFFRFCVPFFFVCSGYFFHKAGDKRKTLKRIAWLYALSYLLYLPAILEGATDIHSVISKLRWNLIFGYEHLWYLNATLEGMLIWYVLEKIPLISKVFQKAGTWICVFLLMLGALLDEHYRLMDNGMLRAVGDFLANFGGPRNAVFMGFPLLVLGGAMARQEERIRKIPVLVLVAVWILFRVLAYWECTYLLEGLGTGLNNDLSFFGCWPALILFALSFRFQIPIPESVAKLLRRMAEYVYILHPMIAMLISKYITMEPLWLWIATILMCSALYILLEKQFAIKK